MDPNATLKQLREALKDGDLERAQELFEALDGWMSRGGYLPYDWGCGTRP